jgi:hypothetical protein
VHSRQRRRISETYGSNELSRSVQAHTGRCVGGAGRRLRGGVSGNEASWEAWRISGPVGSPIESWEPRTKLAKTAALAAWEEQKGQAPDGRGSGGDEGKCARAKRLRAAADEAVQMALDAEALLTESDDEEGHSVKTRRGESEDAGLSQFSCSI